MLHKYIIKTLVTCNYLIGSLSVSSFGVHQVKLTKVAYGFLQTGTRGY